MIWKYPRLQKRHFVVIHDESLYRRHNIATSKCFWNVLYWITGHIPESEIKNKTGQTILRLIMTNQFYLKCSISIILYLKLVTSEHHRQLRPLSDCLRDMGTIDLWYHSRNLRTTYMYSLVKHKQRHHCQWHPKSGCCLRDLLYCRCEFDILQASVCDVSDAP